MPRHILSLLVLLALSMVQALTFCVFSGMFSFCFLQAEAGAAFQHSSVRVTLPGNRAPTTLSGFLGQRIVSTQVGSGLLPTVRTGCQNMPVSREWLQKEGQPVSSEEMVSNK